MYHNNALTLNPLKDLHYDHLACFTTECTKVSRNVDWTHWTHEVPSWGLSLFLSTFEDGSAANVCKLTQHRLELCGCIKNSASIQRLNAPRVEDHVLGIGKLGNWEHVAFYLWRKGPTAQWAIIKLANNVN